MVEAQSVATDPEPVDGELELAEGTSPYFYVALAIGGIALGALGWFFVREVKRERDAALARQANGEPIATYRGPNGETLVVDARLIHEEQSSNGSSPAPVGADGTNAAGA